MAYSAATQLPLAPTSAQASGEAAGRSCEVEVAGARPPTTTSEGPLGSDVKGVGLGEAEHVSLKMLAPPDVRGVDLGEAEHVSMKMAAPPGPPCTDTLRLSEPPSSQKDDELGDVVGPLAGPEPSVDRASTSGSAPSMAARIAQTLFGRTMKTSQPKLEFLCPNGHMMSARITREVFEPRVCGARLNCMHCAGRVSRKHGFYRCHDCDLDCCMKCAQRLSRARIMGPAVDEASSLPSAGDLILTGPTATITHVIVIVTAMTDCDEAAREKLGTQEGQELYRCGTVETTPFYPTDCIVKGKLHRAWYYFERSPHTGVVTVVGSSSWGQETLPSLFAPLYCKFIFNPLRAPGGRGFRDDVFEKALADLQELTPGYGTMTMLKAFGSDRSSVHVSKYTDAESRKELGVKLRRRWLRHPICSSVPVILWQRYFDILHANKGEAAADLAVQDMLKYVPFKADKTTPSTLVKVLTAHGWVLRDDLYALAPALPVESLRVVDAPAQCQGEAKPIAEASAEAGEVDSDTDTDTPVTGTDGGARSSSGEVSSEGVHQASLPSVVDEKFPERAAPLELAA